MVPLVVVCTMARDYSQTLTDSPVSVFGQRPGGPEESCDKAGPIGVPEEGLRVYGDEAHIARGGISVSRCL